MTTDLIMRVDVRMTTINIYSLIMRISIYNAPLSNVTFDDVMCVRVNIRPQQTAQMVICTESVSQAARYVIEELICDHNKQKKSLYIRGSRPKPRDICLSLM